ELVDVGSWGVCAKAAPCYWSPFPPPELRGEPLLDLSTNEGHRMGAVAACALPWLRSLPLQHASFIMSEEASLIALNSLYQPAVLATHLRSGPTMGLTVKNKALTQVLALVKKFIASRTGSPAALDIVWMLIFPAALDIVWILNFVAALDTVWVLNFPGNMTVELMLNHNLGKVIFVY
ncbi:WD repeat-containing protein 43-like protein, partial [Tanacetum coccineum]